MRMHHNQMLEMAREAIELVVLRAQLEIAEHGPREHLFNRIRDLTTAIELIDSCRSVVCIMEKVS